MSADRGRPVMLTQGERRLLVNLCEREIFSLEQALAPLAAHVHRGPVREDVRVGRLRIRQYRRLILELNNPGPSPAPPPAPGGEQG